MICLGSNYAGTEQNLDKYQLCSYNIGPRNELVTYWKRDRCANLLRNELRRSMEHDLVRQNNTCGAVSQSEQLIG